VARVLNEAHLATLLIDLLSADEEAADRYTAHLRFDIGLLTDWLVSATDWLTETLHLPIGYFGAVPVRPPPSWPRPGALT
jgi:putative phosphoribosyl transferase